MPVTVYSLAKKSTSTRNQWLILCYSMPHFYPELDNAGNDKVGGWHDVCW
mgnify:CR=1 FL=1